MSRFSRRRAFTLVEILGLLPIMAAITAMAYMTATRVERMRSRETAARQDDAVLRDIVRRVQEDAARATDASITELPEGSELVLRGASGVVTYQAGSTGLSRSGETADGTAERYGWHLGQVRLSFKAEAIGGKPRIVWIVAALKLPLDEGPDQAHTLAAAAALGREVAP